MWSQCVDGRTPQRTQVGCLARVSARSFAQVDGSRRRLSLPFHPPATAASYSSGLRSVSLPTAHPPNPARRSGGVVVTTLYSRRATSSARARGSSSAPWTSTVISRTPSPSFTVTSGIGGRVSGECLDGEALVVGDRWAVGGLAGEVVVGACPADGLAAMFDRTVQVAHALCGCGPRVAFLAQSGGGVADVVPVAEPVHAERVGQAGLAFLLDGVALLHERLELLFGLDGSLVSTLRFSPRLRLAVEVCGGVVGGDVDGAGEAEHLPCADPLGDVVR